MLIFNSWQMNNINLRAPVAMQKQEPDRETAWAMQVSEISQDLAMLSQSSQDQTQAMDEGTPPEKHMSTGAASAANHGSLRPFLILLTAAP